MEKMKLPPSSYDVFDTLIARRFITNDYILQIIQSTSRNPMFLDARKAADNGNRSLYQIYQELVNQEIINESELMRFYKLEVELEKKHSFALSNIDTVRDGDVLISDMYFSGADILELVRSAGCQSQVTIYQSNSDKRTGVLWDKLKGIKLLSHTGDNITSDVENARERGFDAEHFVDAITFTGIEKVLLENKLSFLGCLVRETRLRNFYPKNRMLSDISCQLNLPMLLIACELLHRRHADENIVFLGRDCQLLYKLYNAFYRNAYYIPFSRKVAYEQPEDAVGFLKAHMPPNAVLVDVSSTGATWEHLCKLHPFNVDVLIYSDVFHYNKTKPTLPSTFNFLMTNTQIGQTNEMIEVFNCADHGYLKSIKNHNGVYFAEFGGCEMGEDDLVDIHYPINLAVETAPNYGTNLATELSHMSHDNLVQLFKEFSELLCKKTEVLSTLGDYMMLQNKYMEEVRNAQNR
jgi:hypothetical protein